MINWQPIDTAPRVELEEVILFNGSVFAGSWWEGRWTSWSDDANPAPTHWMPLPEPPKD